jgi:hypothetical protein
MVVLMANRSGGNNPGGTKTWPTQRIDQLRLLWNKGLSAARIAILMGDGLTKNSIIGAARRAKLDPRPSPIKRSPNGKQPAPKPRRSETSAST